MGEVGGSGQRMWRGKAVGRGGGAWHGWSCSSSLQMLAGCIHARRIACLTPTIDQPLTLPGRYSEAIELLPGKEGLHTLHSNRSLAYYKAQRYSDALADADAAVALATRWPKAHWRRAAALLALKRAPEAVLAYRVAWRLDKQDSESAARLWGAVQRLTREQLARGVLGLLGELQEEGKLEAPQEEEATEGEQTEAMFRRIKMAHKTVPRPGPWYRRQVAGLR